VLSGEEEMIIKALRKKKKHMTQEQLLNAAGLAIHGTNKSILAQMVQRELIDNGTDKRGRGYGLPEWRSKTS
jgi:predicted transcriptional regulator